MAGLSVLAALFSLGVWDFSVGCGFLDSAVGGYVAHEADLIHIAVGVGFGLWVIAVFLAVRYRRPDYRHLLVFPGFVLAYIGVLIAIAAVAPTIWGAAQCRVGSGGGW